MARHFLGSHNATQDVLRGQDPIVHAHMTKNPYRQPCQAGGRGFLLPKTRAAINGPVSLRG